MAGFVQAFTFGGNNPSTNSNGTENFGAGVSNPYDLTAGSGAANGAYGAINANQNLASQMQQYQQAAASKTAPQAGNTNLGPVAAAGTGSYLPQNQNLINSEMAQANGTAPSLAQEQLQQGEQQQVAQQMAVQGSQAGGGNRAGAARTAADTSASNLNTLNANEAQARTQAQIAAQGVVGGQILGAGAQEQATNQFNAGQANQANLAQGTMNQQTNMQNLAAQMQQQGYNQQQIQAMLAGQTGVNQSTINQNMAQNALQSNNSNQYNNLQLQANEYQAGANANAYTDTSNTLGGMGGMMAMSDLDLKTNVAGGNGMLASFLNNLNSQGNADTNNDLSRAEVLTPFSPPNMNAGAKPGDPGASSSSNSSGNGMASMMSSMMGGAGGVDAGGVDAGGVDAGSAGMAAISDEKTKTDKSEDLDKTEAFLDNLKAFNFKYKDNLPIKGTDMAPDGSQTGVMAQDLSKSEIGKRYVQETPMGKAVDFGHMMPVVLAALAYHQDRMNKLEGKNA